nr:farnesyl pyrophosphate synthase-like [Halyomorpha halys]
MPFAKLCVQKLSNPLMKLCYPNLNGRLSLSKFSNSLDNSTFKFLSCNPHTICREHNTVAIRPQTITKDDKRDFMAVFPDIVRDLTQQDPGISDLSTLISKLMQYNVSGGKKVRGLTVVYSYRMLAPDHDLTPENIRLAQIWLGMLKGNEPSTMINLLKGLIEEVREMKVKLQGIDELKDIKDTLQKQSELSFDNLEWLEKIEALLDQQKNKIEELSLENNNLQAKIYGLEARINQAEQNHLNNSVEIRGIPEKQGETIVGTVLSTGAGLGVKLFLDDLDHGLQGFFVVIDDLTDQSVTRRGRPCWYRLPGIGLRASSDALLIQAGTFQLLQQHCKDKEFYVDLVELFLDATRRTTYGQTLDLVSSFPNITHLTMDRYNFITKYKTSYYTFHLPVAIAMYMAGIYNTELHRQAKSVLLEMGHYFQVQDDYLDVFSDEEVSGKKGTDIQEGKCTWLAIIAFQRASPSQREILESCYGSKDPEKIQKVKDIFIEIGLPAVFHAYEEETYNLITRQIQQLSEGLPHELFLTLLHKMYGRKQ